MLTEVKIHDGIPTR